MVPGAEIQCCLIVGFYCFSSSTLLGRVTSNLEVVSSLCPDRASATQKRQIQFAGSLSTTLAISSSVYILKPRALVTLASCTFLASSFSSMTCLSVLSTSVSASAMVRD